MILLTPPDLSSWESDLFAYDLPQLSTIWYNGNPTLQSAFDYFPHAHSLYVLPSVPQQMISLVPSFICIITKWCIWEGCHFEEIIEKLSDFSLVKSKSFLRSCSAPGTGTWSTERRRGVGVVRGRGGGGKHICRWELVVPVNTWSQGGNEMILFICLVSQNISCC